MSLRIYPVILELIREVRERFLPRIQAQDADLARQMKRALESAGLNCGEGMYSRGGVRRARYYTSVGSTREVLSCVEVAFAMGYISEIDAELRPKFDHVIGCNQLLPVRRQCVEIDSVRIYCLDFDQNRLIVGKPPKPVVAAESVTAAVTSVFHGKSEPTPRCRRDMSYRRSAALAAAVRPLGH